MAVPRPQNLQAVPQSPMLVALTWTHAGGANQMEVQRATTPGSFSRIVLLGNVRAYQDSDVQPGTTYRYRVRAKKGQWSAWSVEATATTPAVEVPPPTPEPLPPPEPPILLGDQQVPLEGGAWRGSTEGGPAVWRPVLDVGFINHPEQHWYFTPLVDRILVVKATGLSVVGSTTPYYPAVYVREVGTAFTLGGEHSVPPNQSVETRQTVRAGKKYVIVVDAAPAMHAAGVAVAGVYDLQVATNWVFGSAKLVANVNSADKHVLGADGFRYKLRVHTNDTKVDVRGQTWKILFGFFHTYSMTFHKNAGFECNLGNNRLIYGPTVRHCSDQPWPPGQPQHVEAESAVDFAIQTQQGDRGQRTQDPAFFPGIVGLIDNLPGEWKMGCRSQTNINGEDVQIVFERIGRTTEVDNWACGPLSPDVEPRWLWQATMIPPDGIGRSVHFALPSDAGEHLMHFNPMEFYTEAFYVHRGLWRIFLWDIQYRKAGTWTSLREWIIDPYACDQDPLNNVWGFKKATYNGKAVIECSNDGTPTYLRVGELLTI